MVADYVGKLTLFSDLRYLVWSGYNEMSKLVSFEHGCNHFLIRCSLIFFKSSIGDALKNNNLYD